MCHVKGIVFTKTTSWKTPSVPILAAFRMYVTMLIDKYHCLDINGKLWRYQDDIYEDILALNEIPPIRYVCGEQNLAFVTVDNKIGYLDDYNHRPRLYDTHVQVRGVSENGFTIFVWDPQGVLYELDGDRVIKSDWQCTEGILQYEEYRGDVVVFLTLIGNVYKRTLISYSVNTISYEQGSLNDPDCEYRDILLADRVQSFSLDNGALTCLFEDGVVRTISDDIDV